jgi:hypothetical protein
MGKTSPAQPKQSLQELQYLYNESARDVVHTFLMSGHATGQAGDVMVTYHFTTLRNSKN